MPLMREILPIFPFILFSAFFTSDALKCFTCDGACDCRDNQLLETCSPDSFCFAVTTPIAGQVIRKGCTPDCRLVTTQGWQKCHLCNNHLCNDQEYQSGGLVDDCAVEQLIGLGLGMGVEAEPKPEPEQAPRNQQMARRSLASNNQQQRHFGEGIGGREEQEERGTRDGFGQGVRQRSDPFGQGVQQRSTGFGQGVHIRQQNSQQRQEIGTGFGHGRQQRRNAYFVRPPPSSGSNAEEFTDSDEGRFSAGIAQTIRPSSSRIAHPPSISGTEKPAVPFLPISRPRFGATDARSGQAAHESTPTDPHIGARISAFLERMSPRSVPAPIGFGQGVEEHQKGQKMASPDFGTGLTDQQRSQPAASPLLFQFGDGIAEKQRQQQRAAAVGFGGGVEMGEGGGNGAVLSPAPAMLLRILTLLFVTFLLF